MDGGRPAQASTTHDRFPTQLPIYQSTDLPDHPPTPTAPPPNHLTTHLTQLSPDLRPLALSLSSEPVLITALMQTGTRVDGDLFINFARSNPLGTIRWIVGQIPADNLLELASTSGVFSIFSTATFQPLTSPNQLTIANYHNSFQAVDVHKASLAHAKGYLGTGVTIAIVDTGVDFTHPDMQGTQARVSGGAYEGWPYAYDTFSGLTYALAPTATIGPDTYNLYAGATGYAHTLPVDGANCNTLTCTADLLLDIPNLITITLVWSDTSQSGNYYYTVHPEPRHLSRAKALSLGYAVQNVPAAIIVADEAAPGVYDTVYIDVDFDQFLTGEKPMRKGDELAGADIRKADRSSGQDGLWDIGVGMLTWIADGANQPPGVGTVYNLSGVPIPDNGRLLAFVWDDNGHGTYVAGSITAQSVISDPYALRIANPLVAGGAQIGGVGGPVLAGIAPGAKIAAFQHGNNLPIEAWVLAALGFDGLPESGDETQLVNNSFAASEIIDDGWDAESRFVHYLNRNFAPTTTFLASTGNGGHGYGTNVQPSGGTIIDVGASTSHGTLDVFELVYAGQLTYGDVTPWSDRGPTTLGDPAPDVVCIGSYANTPAPLNVRPTTPANAEEAYVGFSGTSLSSPLCAGVLALGLEAFRQTHGRWPTWEEAHVLLTAGGTDLGHDMLTQGAGNADADRATDIAAGRAVWVDAAPTGEGEGGLAQWVAGGYNSQRPLAYPAIVLPGETHTKTFTVHNPTTSTVTVNLNGTTLTRTHEITLTLTFTSFSGSTAPVPSYLLDITTLIEIYDPDLLRAQVIFPFDVFDTDGDYSVDDLWNVLFYDWTDLNGDLDLWTDANGDGLVDSGEIDTVIDPGTGLQAFEYNRMNSGIHFYGTWGTAIESSIGRDSLSRYHDGVFFGLQRTYGSDPVTVQVRLTFYARAGWPWLSLPASLTIPPQSDVTFEASLTVPPSAPLGTYQGAIGYDTGGPATVIPVLAHIAASGPTFEFGAASLDQPPGGQPHNNGHLYGAFNWGYRWESGDWRFFYYDVPAGSAAPGKVLIVDTQWITTPTDVDTWVFGAAPGVFAASDPAFFGPAHVELVGGSTDTRTSGGTFTFETATGGPREVVAAGLRDGLGFIALHSVLFAGTDFTEPFTGAAYVVETFPTTVTLNATGVVSQPFTHTWTHTFSTTRDISEGITVTVGGSNLIVNGIPPGPILAGTPITFTVTISEAFVPGTAWQGSLLIGPRFAPNALNVPITLRMLDPAAPLTGTLTAAPASVVTGEPATFNLSLSNLSTATETVTVTIPIPVLLAFVPGSENASTGALVYDEDSATLVWSGDLGGGETLSLAYDAQGGAGQGLVQTVASIAALSGQTFALRADVTVNPAATLAASREWLRAGETVTFTLIAPNTYTGTDAVTVTIPIPSLLEMAIGSPTASTGELFYDVVARQLSWNGDLGAGETLTLTYRSTAQSGYGTADTLAAISSLAGSLTTTVSASVFVNPNFGAAVAPGVAAQTGDPGSTVTYTLLVTNTGDTAEAFDVGVSGNLWGTAAPSTAGPLPAGTGAPLTITAAIPPGAMGGVTDRAAITIRSQSDPTQTITAALTTTVNAVYAVELSPGAALGAGHPGETITYTLQITNTGNTTDSFDSAVVTSTWGVALPPTVEALPPGWSATLAVSVTIPITATDSVTGTAIIAVISQGDASVSSRTTLTMQAVWRKVWLPMVRR